MSIKLQQVDIYYLKQWIRIQIYINIIDNNIVNIIYQFCYYNYQTVGQKKKRKRYWMLDQSPSIIESINILQTMTSALKLYKYILGQLELQYHINYQNITQEQLIQKFKKIQDVISNFNHVANNIEEYHFNKMENINMVYRLGHRFINRLIQTTTLYRNKYLENQNYCGFREELFDIFHIIKDYQHCYNGYNNVNTQNTLVKLYPKKYDFPLLFDKICWIVRRSLIKIKENYNNIHLENPIKQNKNTGQSINSLQNTVVRSISQNKQRLRENQKQRQRRNSASETPIVKSLQYKYKLTKEVIGNISLLSGMDIDVTHLRALFFQARSNMGGVNEDAVEGNGNIIKARQQYLDRYLQWQEKLKSKKSKRERSGQVSPSRLNKTSLNNLSTHIPKNPMLITKMTNTESKISKYVDSSLSTSSQMQKNRLQMEQQKKRTKLSVTYNKQFIYLKQIKNQKIVRRPYIQVKQVLVNGDELNYYTNKNNTSVRESNINNFKNKNNFFMQKMMRCQKAALKKKKYWGIENGKQCIIK